MSSKQIFDWQTGLPLRVPVQHSVEFAEKVSDIFNCDASTAIGDVVRPSETLEDTVVTLTSNVFPNTAIGVVIEKPSATTCEGLISGKLENLSGLTFGRAVFIDTDGTLTTTPPATGHQQKMGLAIKSDTMFLLPSLEKVIQ